MSLFLKSNGHTCWPSQAFCLHQVWKKSSWCCSSSGSKCVYIQDGRQAAILNDIKNLFDVHNPQTMPDLGVNYLIHTDVLSVRVPPAELNISAFPPVLRDWKIKGLGMSSLVYATGHIKDPMPLIEKRRGLSPGGRFPPSFIHLVIIITRLNKLYNCMFLPWRWPQMPTGRKTPHSNSKRSTDLRIYTHLFNVSMLECVKTNLYTVMSH